MFDVDICFKKKYDPFKVKGLSRSAQLLDLAVRHYIKIYSEKSSLFSGAQYEIEIIKIART